MGTPKQGLNPTTHSVGLTAKYVTVRSITPDGTQALVVDRQNVQNSVPMLIQRSKGPLPAVGDTWLITQDLGIWTFAAFVASSQSDFAQGGAAAGAAIIVSAQPPASPSTGQLWMNEAEANEIFQWTGSMWLGLQFGSSAIAPKAIGTTEIADGAVTSQQISPTAGILASQVAFSAEQIGGIQVFTSTSEPAGATPGALWFNPGHDNELSVWNGNSWDPLLLGPGAISPSSLTAAQLAADAGILASQVAFNFRDLGGTATTIASIEPSSPKTGDLWFDGSNGFALKQWSGIAWLPYQFSTQALAVGSITTELLAAGIIYAGIVNGTTINAAVFTGSVFEGIDFRLSQNGLFFYAGVPNLGNLLAGFSPPGSSGTDDFGNTTPGMLTAGPNGSGQVVIEPNINQSFNITTAITGVLMGVVQLFSGDAAQVLPGMLASLLLGTGTAAKMSTVLTSPFSTEGAVVLLESQNDGGTDTPVITFGTVSMPDGATMVYVPVMAIRPYSVIIYDGAGNQTVVTHTSGSGTIPIPAGVSTAKAEAWGASGGSSGTLSTGSQNSGGGGGGYGCETALAVTGGGTVAYSVGAGGTAGAVGGSAGNGGDSTVTGSSATVTGHGGHGGTLSGSAAAGGAVSTNSITFKGGSGGVGAIPSGGTAPLGGGGGSSAGIAANGNNGGNYGNGAGGVAPAGGGSGGAGGGIGGVGQSGSNPGGGPGTAGIGNHAGVAGTSGKIRLTYTSGSAGVGISINYGTSFTDPFGNTIPAGTVITGSNTQPVKISTDTWTNVTPPTINGTTTGLLRYRLTSENEVYVQCDLSFTALTAQSGVITLITLTGVYVPSNGIHWPVRVFAAGTPGNLEVTGLVTGGSVQVNNLPVGCNTVAFTQRIPLD